MTGKVRRKGGGGPLLTTKDPTLLADLQRLLEPATMGDPMRPLVWVSKSHEKLATALRQMGHKVSSSTVPKLLRELKYCRHYNRKTKESGKHPDRDAQFEYINAKVEAFQAAGEPTISIDAKKKELLGEFKNGGSDYGPQGQPIEVNTHDFEDKELGKVVPYGVYDIGANLGYVSLGIDHDTGQSRSTRFVYGSNKSAAGCIRMKLPDDHGRRRRLQRFTLASVEVGAPATCR